MDALGGERCRVAVDGPIATVVLHRPERANALDDAFVNELLQVLTHVEASACQVLVLRSHADQFCAGFDLAEVAQSSTPALAWRFLRIGLLLERLQCSPLFTVAVLQGPAIGAGADLAAACDVRLATPGARLRFPGSVFGVVLGTRRLGALVGAATAGRLAATGATVGAEEALRIGLLDVLTEDAAQLSDELARLAASVALRSRDTVHALKAVGRDRDPAGLAELARSLAQNPDLAAAMSTFAQNARTTTRKESA